MASSSMSKRCAAAGIADPAVSAAACPSVPVTPAVQMQTMREYLALLRQMLRDKDKQLEVVKRDREVAREVAFRVGYQRGAKHGQEFEDGEWLDYQRSRQEVPR